MTSLEIRIDRFSS